MPIRPENRDRYPDDWKDIRSAILERSEHKCEWCGVDNYDLHPVTGSKVVLTIAHVHDPDPENCDPENLAALCQKCHLGHDRPYHLAMKGHNRLCRELDAGQLALWDIDLEKEVERIRGLLHHAE